MDEVAKELIAEINRLMREQASESEISALFIALGSHVYDSSITNSLTD